MLIPVIRGAYLINEITRDYTDNLRGVFMSPRISRITRNLIYCLKTRGVHQEQ